MGTALERETLTSRCVDDNEVTVFVVQHQHFDRRRTTSGEREYPGARRWALTTGEAVRVIDGRTYEVIDSGELLRRVD